MIKSNQCRIEFMCHCPDLCKYYESMGYSYVENNCKHSKLLDQHRYECECDRAIDSAMFDARMEN